MLAFIFSLILMSAAALPVEQTYKSQYEDMDIQSILKSSRLLKNYFECLMDRGNCPPPAKEIKEHLEDALKTECTKCTDKQKSIGDTAIDFLIKNKPDMWAELRGKYDPDGTYTAKWMADAEHRKTEQDKPSRK